VTRASRPIPESRRRGPILAAALAAFAAVVLPAAQAAPPAPPSPAEIARDELQAETGLVAAKLEYLGEIYIACGYANQKTHAFVATGLTQAARKPDVEEHDLAVRRVSLAELQQLIRNNVIKDAQTLAAWAFYQARAATHGHCEQP